MEMGIYGHLAKSLRIAKCFIYLNWSLRLNLNEKMQNMMHSPKASKNGKDGQTQDFAFSEK